MLLRYADESRVPKDELGGSVGFRRAGEEYKNCSVQSEGGTLNEAISILHGSVF